MSSNPVHVWIFSCRPYFHHCLSSLHNCEDRFHIHFYSRSSHIWFSYLQSLLHVFFIRSPFQRFNRLQMSAAFSSQNDHLLRRHFFIVFFTLSPSNSAPQVQKKDKHGPSACDKSWRCRHFVLFERNSFSARYSFKILHIVTELLSSVVSVESENCRWRLENLETSNTNLLMWNWCIELLNILKPDNKILSWQKFAGSQTNTAVLISPTLFVKASVDSLGF